MKTRWMPALTMVLVVCTTAVCAEAQDAPAASSPAASSPAASSPAASSPTGDQQHGPRFRWGISAGGGYESVSSVSGPMFGGDLRLGVQLNELFAFYAQPHLSFGALSTDAGGVGVSGATGTFAISGIAEATLRDRFFAGVGGGWGVLNNPNGAMFHGRFGAYPLMKRDREGSRRGLMLGMDIRTIFITGATGLLIMGSIGYEAF